MSSRACHESESDAAAKGGPGSEVLIGGKSRGGSSSQEGAYLSAEAVTSRSHGRSTMKDCGAAWLSVALEKVPYVSSSCHGRHSGTRRSAASNGNEGESCCWVSSSCRRP